eukprot:snap_masked-scaffold_11-processed-gene-4.11-mRNA-1 protein AED:1.00 eAED:1.00 QI:0/-1/0/0/-1/1/1/0/841
MLEERKLDEATTLRFEQLYAGDSKKKIGKNLSIITQFHGSQVVSVSSNIVFLLRIPFSNEKRKYFYLSTYSLSYEPIALNIKHHLYFSPLADDAGKILCNTFLLSGLAYFCLFSTDSFLLFDSSANKILDRKTQKISSIYSISLSSFAFLSQNLENITLSLFSLHRKKFSNKVEVRAKTLTIHNQNFGTCLRIDYAWTKFSELKLILSFSSRLVLFVAYDWLYNIKETKQLRLKHLTNKVKIGDKKAILYLLNGNILFLDLKIFKVVSKFKSQCSAVPKELFFLEDLYLVFEVDSGQKEKGVFILSMVKKKSFFCFFKLKVKDSSALSISSEGSCILYFNVDLFDVSLSATTMISFLPTLILQQNDPLILASLAYSPEAQYQNLSRLPIIAEAGEKFNIFRTATILTLLNILRSKEVAILFSFSEFSFEAIVEVLLSRNLHYLAFCFIEVQESYIYSENTLLYYSTYQFLLRYVVEDWAEKKLKLTLEFVHMGSTSLIQLFEMILQKIIDNGLLASFNFSRLSIESILFSSELPNSADFILLERKFLHLEKNHIRKLFTTFHLRRFNLALKICSKQLASNHFWLQLAFSILLRVATENKTKLYKLILSQDCTTTRKSFISFLQMFHPLMLENFIHNEGSIVECLKLGLKNMAQIESWSKAKQEFEKLSAVVSTNRNLKLVITKQVSLIDLATNQLSVYENLHLAFSENDEQKISGLKQLFAISSENLYTCRINFYLNLRLPDELLDFLTVNYPPYDSGFMFVADILLEHESLVKENRDLFTFVFSRVKDRTVRLDCFLEISAYKEAAELVIATDDFNGAEKVMSQCKDNTLVDSIARHFNG